MSVIRCLSSSSSKTRPSVNDVRKARLITALKTPYLPSGKVDLASYDVLVEKQIECVVEGVIVGGTTGEGQLMSWDEHIMLIAHTAKFYGEKLQIVGNTGSNSTREAVHATSQGFAVGEFTLGSLWYTLGCDQAFHASFASFSPLSQVWMPPFISTRIMARHRKLGC